MKMRNLMFAGLLASFSLALFNSCTQKATATGDNTNLSAKEQLIAEGQKIFQAKCSSCHPARISKEQELRIRSMAKGLKKPPFNAPPMNEVSARIKHFYPNEDDFVAFVTDYISNPSREKGKCLPMAFKMFGVMPPIKDLSEDEKIAVALWLYHNYNDRWEDFGIGK